MKGLRPGKRYRGCLETAGKNGDRQDDLQRAAGC